MDRELLNELKSFLAERMVDNMSTEQLAEYVQDDLFTYFDKQGEHDFLEEANNYWGDHLGEVIDEIQDYMKCDFKKDKVNEVLLLLKVSNATRHQLTALCQLKKCPPAVP